MLNREIKVHYSSAASLMTDHVFDVFIGKLPVDIQKKIVAFKKWKNQQECLLGKLLLLHSLTGMGYKNDCLEKIVYNDYGRPYIDDDIDFNISHSAGNVVCAVAKGLKVGIDIEEIKYKDLSDYKISMTDDQWDQIYQSSSPHRKFFQYWTIKESVVKAYGKGMYVPLNEIFIQNNIAGFGTNKWHLYPITIDNEYSCTLASNVIDSIITFEKIDLFNKL